MKSIFLSAGHSDTDPGAVAFGRKEADIAVEFRNIVAFYVDRYNANAQSRIKLGLDGHGTQNLPLTQAAKDARKYDLAVEFHCNAATPAATGAEVLAGPANMKLAARISAAMARGLDIRDRGAKPENAGQHSRLAFVQAGGMVAELFFLTNVRDLAQYDARKWLAAREVAFVLIEAAGGTP